MITGFDLDEQKALNNILAETSESQEINDAAGCRPLRRKCAPLYARTAQNEYIEDIKRFKKEIANDFDLPQRKEIVDKFSEIETLLKEC